MSDLAPFVAATIRDRVVDDLMTENQRLREELIASRRIKVTSNRQRLLHSVGSVEAGSFHRNNHNLWVVPLQSLREVPLKELTSFELRLGDVPLLLAQSNVARDTFLSIDDTRPRPDDAVPMTFSSHGADIRLGILLKNWPSNALLENFAQLANDGVNSMFSQVFGAQHPDMTAEFVEAVISVKNISDIIDSLPLEGAEAERRQAQQRSHKVYMAAMRIFAAEYDAYDATDSGLDQCIGMVANELESQGLTDIESEEFRDAVIRKFPVFEEENDY